MISNMSSQYLTSPMLFRKNGVCTAGFRPAGFPPSACPDFLILLFV